MNWWEGKPKTHQDHLNILLNADEWTVLKEFFEWEKVIIFKRENKYNYLCKSFIL